MAENNIMPFYNSSEVFVPVKQYRNTIHIPWILKRLKRTEMHYVSLFTSDHVHEILFSSDSSQCTIIDPYIY